MLLREYIVAFNKTIVSDQNQAAQQTLITVVYIKIYIACFSATWDPVAWVVTEKLYPISIGAKYMSLPSVSNWFFNFALGYAAPYMKVIFVTMCYT
jgi:hypothetical protein